METKQSVGQYIGKNTNRYFKIPAYQRGYKWGVLKQDNSCDASILVQDIREALRNNKAEYFIQGVTVYENGNEIVLIDGQQRTTTLFVLLSLLLTKEEIHHYLFFNDCFKLKYNIRRKTEGFLSNLCFQNGVAPNEGAERSQDEYFLEQASLKIAEVLPEGDEERKKLKDYILERVKLFYIKIPEKHATRIFSMLNGSKAFMTTDELIKSAFLSEATKVQERSYESKSLEDTLDNLKTQIGEEWHTITERSRYARQWDKWLYWWNRPDVKAFYHCGTNPMGRLLEYFYKYCGTQEQKNDYSNSPQEVATMFKQFQNSFIQDSIKARENFEALHRLQKTFEDLYHSVTPYNYLGIALMVSSAENYLKIISYFIKNFKSEEKLRKYALLTLVNATPKEIRDFENGEDNQEIIKEKVSMVIAQASSRDVYNNESKEDAFKMLFLLNVLASNDRKVRFEFFYLKSGKWESFYGKRSLEHIWPKSKVKYQKNEVTYAVDEKNKEHIIEEDANSDFLRRNDFPEELSEHCIGNLLLLHKVDNSKFNAKVPEDKKLVYFDLSQNVFSRNLLHTMSAFAVAHWSQENAISNIKSLHNQTIQKIKTIYNEFI